MTRRDWVPLILTLVATLVIVSPARADVTHDPVEDWFGMVLLTASTGIQYPQVDEPVNGGSVVEQSDSNHYVKVGNFASGAQTVHVDYRMGLYHDGSITAHSTNNVTDASIPLAAGASRTLPAGLTRTFTIPVGAHSVTAEADIREHGAGNPWVVAYGHTHPYTRNN